MGQNWASGDLAGGRVGDFFTAELGFKLSDASPGVVRVGIWADAEKVVFGAVAFLGFLDSVPL